MFHEETPLQAGGCQWEEITPNPNDIDRRPQEDVVITRPCVLCYNSSDTADHETVRGTGMPRYVLPAFIIQQLQYELYKTENITAPASIWVPVEPPVHHSTILAL